MGPWLLATTLRRTRAQWRLLLGVVAVAVLASVLVTTLGLLVTMTEAGGVRRELATAPAEQTALSVRLIDPTIDIADGRTEVGKAVDRVFGTAATTTSSGMALSPFETVDAVAGTPPSGETTTTAYFGEFDGISDAASLTQGEWPLPSSSTAAPVQIAIPASAARALTITVGTVISLGSDSDRVTAVVAGVYEPRDPSDSFWQYDRLAGRGYDPAFSDPAASFYNPGVAFGPLVVAAGALAAADIPVAFADLRYTPEFSKTTVDQLQPLLNRLKTADIDIPFRAIGVAGSVFVDTDAANAVSAVASGLTVTRSTVAVISLLLVVLAVAAMAQVARLFSDARAGERQLMRARGASRRNILALAVVEALVVAAATAAATPPLASFVYRLLAMPAPMVAAGLPADAGMPPVAWFVAGGVALLFVAVLVGPLVRGDASFAEGAQIAGRQRAASGMARSGLDLALVALAALAYWQLQLYRTPVQDEASLAVDPVLVAGPAIVLVAAALVCVRLIPAASRLLERLGSVARGATVALAAWEIGRRAQRATAAVLLLSLTLAVGTFGICFLATWKQSQIDQAAFATGPPVRVAATGAVTDSVASTGEDATAEPVSRQRLLIGGVGGDTDDSAGELATLLSLTPAARGMLADGRLGSLGGNAIVDELSDTVKAGTGIDLPAGAVGFSATVQIGDAARPSEATAASINAIIQDARGRLSLLPLGRVDVDGAAHPVRGDIAKSARAVGLRFVGFQANLVDTADAETEVDRKLTATDVLMKDMASLVSSPSPGAEPVAVALTPEAGDAWSGSSSLREPTPPPTDNVPAGWQLRLGIVIPEELRSRATDYALVGWTPNQRVPAVLSQALARKLGVTVGTDLSAHTGDEPTTITVTGIAPLVPGAATVGELAGSVPALGATTAEVAVVDQTRLTRSLIESGATGPFVDEWWLGVAPGHAAAFVAALPHGVESASAQLIGDRLQQSPLRVATQAALWVAIAASTLLAAVGFGVHSAAGLRSRRLELAQLRAIGYSRRRLVGLVATESLLMCVLGAVFGITIGVLLAWLVGPLVAVSPTGAPTVPSVVVEVPAVSIALLIVEVVVVLAAVVMLVARVQRFTEPAHLLREGAQP